MTLNKLAMAVLVAGIAAGHAHAAPIFGAIGFSGTNGATIQITPALTGYTVSPANGNVQVDLSEGSFDRALSNVGSIGTLNAFNTAGPFPATVWTVGIFRFAVESIVPGSLMADNADPFRRFNFDAIGTVSAAGFDATKGLFTFQASSTRGRNLTFQTFTDVNVPEPTGASLVGVVLLGLGAQLRRRRARI